jgi:heme-degrading monooxygenase HmoA
LTVDYGRLAATSKAFNLLIGKIADNLIKMLLLLPNQLSARKIRIERMIAKTPLPPYYAVIFTNLRTEIGEGYEEMADEMVRLAELQPGYLGHESARNKLGITISYWESLEAIKNWKANTEHLIAQRFGREKWYSSYKTRIAKVERDYDFNI